MIKKKNKEFNHYLKSFQKDEEVKKRTKIDMSHLKGKNQQNLNKMLNVIF